MCFWILGIHRYFSKKWLLKSITYFPGRVFLIPSQISFLMWPKWSRKIFLVLSDIENWMSYVLFNIVVHMTDEASGELMATFRQEMDQYLSKQRLTMTKDSNPLSWWKDNHNLFPNLAAIAKQYVAVQASSASSERMFSKANILLIGKDQGWTPK